MTHFLCATIYLRQLDREAPSPLLPYLRQLDREAPSPLLPYLRQLDREAPSPLPPPCSLLPL